ncbi:MAG: type I restriction endonuclease subunit R [Methanobacteriaceae archaeon]|nr:type I restriction endonuclease subunit R [Methanobacteriaceae archaeon]
MSTQSEEILENELINKLVNEGYQQVEINNEKELITNFKKQLEKINKTTFSNEEFEKIMLHLEGGSVFEKAKKLRDRYELNRKEGTKYICFLKKNWCKNIFQVTHQITIEGKYKNRYDVTILINGLPLVQIELKKRGIELKKAFNQIERYQQHSFHGLFNYVQIFIISNGVNTKYYANNRKLGFKYTFSWKDKNNQDINRLEEFADTFLEKCHLSKMIVRYIVLNESTKSLMILRAYQYYAVEAILEKALNTKNNGYVWHTTGSGKTLTSFKVAQILQEEDTIDKVMFIVDRKDLDYQTTKEFNNMCDGAVDGTNNTKSLIRQLKGQNKLIITTIQKLNNAIKNHEKGLEKVKNKKMILMFDECHRSQFGEMHNNITNYFNNIQYFGFTGTPIFSINSNNNKTTKDIFKNELHSYLIKDAIRDDNVLGFMVEYIGVYKNKIKYDIEVEAIDTKEVMENEKRLNKITDYIIENHSNKTYNKEFTSIFAVSSIDVLNKYYDLFKSKNHDLKIATIYSFDSNEDPEGKEIHSRDKLEEHIKDYNNMFETNFSTDTFNQYYVDISKKSKEKKIDILLVVNMFLTGFDNKYLNTLYVDKNLNYHNLIQAFSRTNRILDEKKKQGNIICFRYLKEQVDDAVRLYSDENALDIVLMKPYEEYVNNFNETSEKLYELVSNPDDVNKLPSEKEEKTFIQIFRELLRIMTRLTVFTEFNFKNLNIPEQEFEDFRSKYIDLYDKYVKNSTNKTSVLDDIDFEIELVRRDNINVSYILSLLKELDYSSPTFVKDKEFIINAMENSVDLKSKASLVEEFINLNSAKDNISTDTEEEFNQYIGKEKEKSINNLIKKENLDPKITKDVIYNYEFSGKIKNGSIKPTLKDKLGMREKQEKCKILKDNIINLVDKFTW